MKMSLPSRPHPGNGAFEKTSGEDDGESLRAVVLRSLESSSRSFEPLHACRTSSSAGTSELWMLLVADAETWPFTLGRSSANENKRTTN